MRCRHCDHDRLQKWGRARGRVRYRCTVCGRTCSEVRHDARANESRNAERRLLLSMLTPMPVRAGARLLELRPRTVLAHRHRVIRALASVPIPPLTGQVIIVRVPVILHGLQRREEPFALLSMLSTHDGAQRVAAASLNPSTHEWERVLRHYVDAHATVVYAWGRLGSVGAAARRVGLRYVPANDPQVREQWTALRAVAWTHGAAIRKWLMQFHGVRGRRLHHYIAWYDALASAKQAADPTSAWLARCELATTRASRDPEPLGPQPH